MLRYTIGDIISRMLYFPGFTIFYLEGPYEGS